MVGPCSGAEFVVAAAHVLDECVTSDDHCRGAVGLQSAHRPQPCFQPFVVALDTVFAYLIVLCDACGNWSSMTFANAAAWSVTTSSGSRCAAIAVVKNLRVAAMSQREDVQVDDLAVAADLVLRALADPTRRSMLRLVRSQELAAGQIATHFPISQQGVSQHLQVLHRAGLIAERREGTRRLYLLQPDASGPVRALLEDLWPDAFERLKHIVDEHKRSRS
jgi:DNA-binding transcriptional ArsR family regulator